MPVQHAGRAPDIVLVEVRERLAAIARNRLTGCAQIFQEKISGARSNRKQLARVIDRVGA
jgi:hypothetical protein